MNRQPQLISPPVLSRRSLLAAIGLGATAATLSGCGMQPAGEGEGASVIRAAFDRPILDLNPFGPANVEQSTLLAAQLIFDPLVARDGADFTPALAEEWTQPDEKNWVFSLRKVKCHDGTPLTAQDVSGCLEEVAGGKTPQAALWAALDEVSVDNDHTLTISTKTPLGTMLSNLSLLSILPVDRIGDKGFFAKPIGSGPFQVESFTASDHLTLRAAKDYWGGAPACQRLELPYIPETSTRITSVKTGEVDVTWSIPPDQMAQVQDPQIKAVSIPSYINYFNWFNCSRKPFDDARVRRAMWHAIDVDQVVADLFGDSAEVADAPIPTAVFGHAAQQPYRYDPELAKKLLAQAGHGGGFSTHLIWAQGVAPQARQLAESFASYWKEVDVIVELQELEQAEWLERLLALDWDMDLQNAATATGDADYTLGRLYTSEANRMGYSNPDLDDILVAARSTAEQEERAALYAKACKIIWEEAVGIFPLQLLATYAVRDDVKGFEPAANNQPNFVPVVRS